MRDRSTSGDGGSGEPWVLAEMKDVLDGASILVVEDDDDIRDLMVTLLKIAGYSPTACPDAESGLEALRQETFDLVLTDYALPNRTGGWLLQQASAEGLLDATPALVVTAYPNPPDTSGFEIVQKPFDLDDLVGRVKVRLEGAGSSNRGDGRSVRAAGSRRPGDGHDGDCPDPIELILYVNAESPRSASALKDIERVLAGYRSGQVTLTICDVSRNLATGSEGPTTVRPAPGKRRARPRTFIVGHTNNRDVVLELLDGCGLAS
jgi:CheY-like chemotaxis protein